jgi:Zn-finger nucleic acid-binding protein
MTGGEAQPKQATLRCPDCSTELAPHTERGVHLDRCRACGGIWFDRGELEAHQGKAGMEHELSHRKDAAAPVLLKASPGSCPRCGKRALGAGEYSGTAFQRCSACGGVFLPGPSLARLVSGAARGGSGSLLEAAGRSAAAGVRDGAALGLELALDFVGHVVFGVFEL